VKPFDSYSAWYRIYFSLYIVLTVIGVLNILTGVFVTRATEISVLEKDLILHSQKARERSAVTGLWELFREIDKKHCGTVDTDQLTRYLSHEDGRAYFAALQLNCDSAKEMISLLDPGRTGMVSMK